MAFFFQECEPFRKGLTPQSSVDIVAWAYLQALYQAQQEVGIYYIFEPEQVDIPKTVKIINRLSRLKLARTTTQELGTKNMYMEITEEGTHVADQFSSLADYENHLANEERKKLPNSGIIIGGSVSITGNQNQLILGSKHVNVNAQQQIQELVDKAIEVINETDLRNRDAYIATLRQLQQESTQGQVTPSTFREVLAISDQVGSVSGFILSILNQLQPFG